MYANAIRITDKNELRTIAFYAKTGKKRRVIAIVTGGKESPGLAAEAAALAEAQTNMPLKA